MRLILNGGGSDEQVVESYKLFASLVGSGKVLYIPLAWTHGNMESCIDWFKSQMLPFNITNIEQVLNPNLITKEKLSEVKGVFIGGGNTYKLLKLLKETQAFDNLKHYIDNDGLVMGGSAGALIFGKSIDTCLKDDLNIESCCDENLVCLKDTDGFDCVKGFSILPHYQKVLEQFLDTQKRVDRLLNNDFKLICLPEETSIFVDDNKIQVIGKKPAILFNKNISKIINVNDFIKI